MGKAFMYITLWYTKTTPVVLLSGGPTVVWPLNNKNSSQRLIKKKDQNNLFGTCAVHFVIGCELTPQK